MSPLGTTALDFDTREGAYSYWRVGNLDTVNAIRTTLQIHRLGQDSNWAPVFTIALVGGMNKINFQIESLTRHLPLMMHVMKLAGQKPDTDHTFKASIGLDQKVELSFDWTPDGEVSILAGTEAYSVALGSPATSVEFYGSTGEVEFDPLQLGRSAP